MKTEIRNELRRKIRQAILFAKKAHEQPDAYPYLPEILASLERMQKSPSTPSEARLKMASNLGRLVTEDYGFSESPLGTTLLKLAEDFASR